MSLADEAADNLLLNDDTAMQAWEHAHGLCGSFCKYCRYDENERKMSIEEWQERKRRSRKNKKKNVKYN